MMKNHVKGLSTKLMLPVGDPLKDSAEREKKSVIESNMKLVVCEGSRDAVLFSSPTSPSSDPRKLGSFSMSNSANMRTYRGCCLNDG